MTKNICISSAVNTSTAKGPGSSHNQCVCVCVCVWMKLFFCENTIVVVFGCLFLW